MEWTRIITEVGVLAGITLFLVWTSWKREERLASRVTNLETFVNEKLIAILTDSHDHLKRNSDALRQNTEAINRLIEIIGDRPCMLEDVQKLHFAVDRVLERANQISRHEKT